MIKAVIFDLDDTLIPENKYVESGFNIVSKYLEQQYSGKSEDIYKELICLYKENSKNVFNRWFDKKQIKYTMEEIKQIVKVYREHKPTIEFYSDVIPTIKKLKEKNIKIGIITDGYVETQKAKLQSLNAYSIFDEIVITDELGRQYWKPHPRAFEIMKKKLNIEFEEMIYVGDNPEKDFYIGSLYPIACVRICRNDCIYGDKKYKNEFREKYKIKNLNELMEKI